MARIMAIDYGQVRTGVAVSDNLQMIANSLDTVPTQNLFPYLSNYLQKEKVELLVIGYPKTLQNTPAEIIPLIDKFINEFIKKYPHIKVEKIDERYTSKMAFQAIIDSGIGKKARQNKGLIDKVSATIILENYLEWRR